MTSSLAIIGRPNVGKSSLFNKLVKKRSAIVTNLSGVTRDKNIGFARISNSNYLIIDTGGINDTGDKLSNDISEHAWDAAIESEIIYVVVDGSEDLTATDLDILSQVRKLNKKFFVIVNKTDKKTNSSVQEELQKKGYLNKFIISAEHSIGIDEIRKNIQEYITPQDASVNNDNLKIAIVGRPNSGKSTFLNSVAKENRAIVSDLPGTTIDSIETKVNYNDKEMTLIDTAGISRKYNKSGKVEYFSYIKTIDAINRSTLVLVFLDITSGLVDQDLRIINLAKLEGKPIIIVVNKIDLVKKSEEKKFFDDIKFRNPIFQNLNMVKISAKNNVGIDYLVKKAVTTFELASKKFTTRRLNNLIDKALDAVNVPSYGGREIKIKYVNFGGNFPTKLIIHSNFNNSKIPSNFRRYLTKFYEKELLLKGVDVQLFFKKSVNPFENKKNELSPRQKKKRKRHITYLKKKKK